jgi:hypothetical protein
MEMTWPTAFSHLFDGLIHFPEHRSTLGTVLVKPLDELSEREQNEVWALGQHYGLKTPLLDWTSSPYVALFFACTDIAERIDGGLDAPRLAVWGMCPALLSQVLGSAKNPSHFIGFYPRYAKNDRIVVQQGSFTRLAPEGDLVARVLTAELEDELEPELIKITLPVTAATRCLEHLFRMNVGYHSLFPDIEGISKFGNYAAINADYTGRAWGGVAWGFNVPGTGFSRKLASRIEGGRSDDE